MDLDPTILQIIIRRRQAAAISRSHIHTALSITPILLAEDDEDIYDLAFPSHGGSRPGKLPNRPRDFEGSYHRLMEHYFSARPLYDDQLFRRRFQMGKPLFLRIAEAVEDFVEYAYSLVSMLLTKLWLYIVYAGFTSIYLSSLNLKQHFIFVISHCHKTNCL
jgi:DNA repair photolyase